MGIQAVEVIDLESERRRRVAELVAEEGPGWSKPFEPGSLGCHELMDRTAMIERLLEDAVLFHPACLREPEWFALAERAAAALGELYQRIGQEHAGPGDDRVG